jgi:phosphatidylserine decarboxylase
VLRLIAKGGRKFVGLGAAVSVLTLPFFVYVGLAFVVLTSFFICVFRDPKREIGKGIVAPADGTVREVDHEKGLVSTYLALRNVHVTRTPIEGVVLRTTHQQGRHLPAFTKSTTDNERVEISIKTKIGEVSIVEMTGAIARRIVPYIREGQNLNKGEKLSLIRFGSRVDLYLPPSSVRILVSKGQRLHAGVTCIAEVCDGSVE